MCVHRAFDTLVADELYTKIIVVIEHFLPLARVSTKTCLEGMFNSNDAQ